MGFEAFEDATHGMQKRRHGPLKGLDIPYERGDLIIGCGESERVTGLTRWKHLTFTNIRPWRLGERKEESAGECWNEEGVRTDWPFGVI